MSPLYPFYLKGPHHSTGPMPTLPPSHSKVSTTQLSYVPPQPPSPSNVSITQLSSAPHPLLNQRSAQLKCHMSPSALFPLKDQHHSTVIGPLLRPSTSNVSITQLSYACIYPFSINGQHHSTVLCPPLSPSLTKVSITQLSYAPLYLLLNQRSATLNCHMSSLRPLRPQRSA